MTRAVRTVGLAPAVATLVTLAWATGERWAVAAPEAALAPAMVAVAAERIAADDDPDGEGRKKDKRDPVTVRGCLHGTTLGDVRAEEGVEGLTPSVALKGSRAIRKKLKDYDRHEVEVTGVLTPAPRSPLSGRWGGTTVSIGGADPRRPIGQQAPPPVASMEVMSVTSVTATCR